ncbi:MAG: hypothetical protein RLY83_145 [Actinomycetota bacterium]
MKRKIQRFIGATVSVLLAFVGLVVTSSASDALSGSSFKPGLIISDTVFFDYGTMSASKIQAFLESKVPVCTDNDGGPKCLRNYTETVVGSVAIKSNLHDYGLRLCETVPASTTPLAASTIIYQVAVACKINPQVLLVTLQKEQGLVGAADPTTYMYKAAMGYGCPDSAPQVCGQDSNKNSRLFWQLYRAAWQMKYYGHPSGTIKYYKPGAVHNIQYHPKTSCGKKGVYIESQGTANLYYYTPYQPNTAALNNLGGTGDSCSAYGNRNFWRYFWSWFGNPTVGVNLIRSSATTDGPNYLVNLEANVRYRIPSDEVLADYKTLGAVGAHSNSFVNSFTDGGDLGSIVADKLGNRYLISSGSKFKLADSAQASALGLDWSQARLLTDPQINTFPNLVFAKSPSTDKVYLLQGTTKAPVESAELLKALSVMGSTGVVKDAILDGFTLTTAVNELVQDSSGVRYDIQDGQKILIPTESLATALGRRWGTATVIATSSLAKIPTAAFLAGPTANSNYFLSSGTKHLSNASMAKAMSKFGSTAKVSADYLSHFTTGVALGSLLKTTTDTWYISENHRFKITAAQSAAIGKDFTNAVLVSTTQIATISAPILMKSSAAGTTYLVDDYTNRYPLSSSQMKHYSSLGATGIVPASYLSAFTAKTDPGRFVNCSTDGQHYYLVDSKRYRVADANTAKAIAPSIFTESDVFGSLPSLTTSELSKYAVGSTTSYVTTYAKSSAGNYILENGRRRQILDSPSVAAALTSVPAVSVLSAAYFSALPLGAPIVSDSTMFKNSTSGAYGVYTAGTYYPLTTALYNEVKTSAAWHFTKSTGTLSAESIAKLTQGGTIPSLGLIGGSGYLISAAGKQQITDIRNVVANPATISSAVASRIDDSTLPALTTPFVVKASAAAAPAFLISGGVKRQTLDAGETTSILPLVTNSNVQIWPQAAIDAITSGSSVIAPGSVVKVKESGNLYLIDGWGRGLRVTTKISKAFGVNNPKVATRAQLVGYNTSSVLDWQKVVCGSNTYLVDSGSLLQIDANAVASWPGQGATLDAKTCTRLAPGNTRIGFLLAYGTAKYKLVDKKLRLIRTSAEYTTLANGQTVAALVSGALISELPKGNPTSYSVVSKDTLYSVAVKFKTTRALLRSLNRLTTDTLTVGQVLNLP